MTLYINASNREINSYKIIKDLANENARIISLAGKDLKYCLGCNSCKNKLETKCILNDYITNEVFRAIDKAKDIVICCPLYMSHITGRLKTLIDRLYPYYNHGGLNGRNIYLVLNGYGSEEDNQEEINDIIKYFSGISEWLDFNFKYLDYFCTNCECDVNDYTNAYDTKIQNLKNKLN